MSDHGAFTIDEDPDIVNLTPQGSGKSCTGWVNIGVHAVKISQDDQGHLLVESFPRCQEHEPLASMSVDRHRAVVKGGRNPDDGPLAFIDVTYDENYRGGPYEGSGGIEARVPMSMIDQFKDYGYEEADAVKLAFERFTRINLVHVVRYDLEHKFAESGEALPC